MNAHRAHDLFGHAAQAGVGHQRLVRCGAGVDGVQVMAIEHALLLAEHLAAQSVRVAQHPGRAAPLHADFAGGVGQREIAHRFEWQFHG
jgi:hypothetical protein